MSKILTILYASQTGVCEQISLDLKEEAVSKQFTVERYSFDEFMKKCELFEKAE